MAPHAARDIRELEDSSPAPLCCMLGVKGAVPGPEPMLPSHVIKMELQSDH